MNRFKKNELQLSESKRTGLSADEIKSLDEQEALEAKIMERARKIHADLFGEEYNFMYADAFGEPKPSPKEIKIKNEYRKKYNLPLLDDNGKSDEFQEATMQHCIELSKKEL
jgi:hypothetical protein